MGRGKSGTGSTAAGKKFTKLMGGGSSAVADAVYDEIETGLGRRYKREYANGLAEGGADSMHFPDMIEYITRNAKSSDQSLRDFLPEPEGRPYRDVVRDALGKRTFEAIDEGMREGAQRWLDDHPTGRRRRRQSTR